MVDLTIQDVAFGGKGVGREQGKAVFVPYTIDSELVSAEIVREKKQFAEADLIEVRQPSPHRIDPPCPYFGRCGGCAYQHMDYPHQLEIKARQVRDVLQRLGKLKDLPVQPIVASPDQYGYRNRITVHAMDGVIGFYRRDSNRLIDIERCPISQDEVNERLKKLRTTNPRDGHYTLRALGGTSSVSSQKSRDDTHSTISGQAPVVPLRIFSQVNDKVANKLRDLLDTFILSNQQLLIDAYCGAGFFAKALREKFVRVIGIDWDRFAIEAAQRDAGPTENYISGDVELELRKIVATQPENVVLIVDPPATGLTAGVRSAIVDLAPRQFIYVSCNPATLARDLRELVQKFTIESVVPFDMFPQTAEIEVVVRLQA